MTPNPNHSHEAGTAPHPRVHSGERTHVLHHNDPRPTPKQMSYLRALAHRTGQTFTYPQTAGQASREIRRLKGIRPSSRIEVRIERKQIADAIAAGPDDSTRVRDDELAGYGPNATWAHNETTEPTDPVAPEARSIRQVALRTELARYSLSDGTERVLFGQRLAGIVSFLPDDPVVLDAPSAGSEDSSCCPRETLEQNERWDAARQERPNGDHEPAVTAEAATGRRGRTGARVELARYAVSAGKRVLYGQRVFGVVRVTDVPDGFRGRAYLVERGLEQEGAGANAALVALIADYLREASRLDAVPMSASLLECRL